MLILHYVPFSRPLYAAPDGIIPFLLSPCHFLRLQICISFTYPELSLSQFPLFLQVEDQFCTFRRRSFVAIYNLQYLIYAYYLSRNNKKPFHSYKMSNCYSSSKKLNHFMVQMFLPSAALNMTQIIKVII